MLLNEGKAKIEIEQEVFYNKRMKKLRDLSVSFLNAASDDSEGYLLLDATSATGVRGIRYVLECPVKNVVFIDINEKAYENTVRNLKLNGIVAKVENRSIQEFANTTDAKFDIIDLDPFGSPAPYIYDIMKIAKDNSILMVTATDTAVLCGAHADACIRTYASVPLHNELCHEAGTRILINYIARIASQFNFGIKVLFAVAEMHYIRVFLKLQHGASNVKSSLRDAGFGAYCGTCHNFHISPGIAAHVDDKCDYCGARMNAFGPLWLGNLSDNEVAKEMLKHAKANGMDEAEKTLRVVLEELDMPFYYHLPTLTKYLKVSSVPMDKVISMLSKKFEVSRTHFDIDAIKTNARIGEVYECVSVISRSNKRA